MRKIFKSVVFLSAMLVLSVIMCGMAVGKEDWTWAGIWFIGIVLDIFQLRKAINIHDGRYKNIQSASAGYTAVGIFAVLAASHNKDQTVLMWCWLVLGIFNFCLIVAQRRLFKRMVKMDKEFDNWVATNFPEDKMGDITLERKR